MTVTPRRQAILDGTSGIPLHKTNLFRKKAGLPPLRSVKVESRTPPETSQRAVVREVSSIGTRLHSIIRRESGGKIDCGECRREVSRLNRMTAKEAKADRVNIATGIHNRAKEKAPKLWQRLGIRFEEKFTHHGFAMQKFLSWVDEAIATGAEPEKPKRKPKQEARAVRQHTKVQRRGRVTPGNLWRKRNPDGIEDSVRESVVGIVSCAQRMQSLLPETVDSLKRAGFSIDRVFVDGGDPGLEIPATVRTPAIGPHGNTILALQELFFRYRKARRFFLFQDDCRAVAGLAEYLRKQQMEPMTWWNLISHKSNEELARQSRSRGWFRSNQLGHGAVGLAFSAEGLRTLLSSQPLMKWAVTNKPYPTQIDFAIASVMQEAGYTELCHSPSLLQHTGVSSTLRLKDWPKNLSGSYPGDDFDVSE